MLKVNLNAQHRYSEVEVPIDTRTINIAVSRLNCKDVLLELIDNNNEAKGKPLEKCLPKVEVKQCSKLRFIMNDFSTKPIEIELSWK